VKIKERFIDVSHGLRARTHVMLAAWQHNGSCCYLVCHLNDLNAMPRYVNCDLIDLNAMQ